MFQLKLENLSRFLFRIKNNFKVQIKEREGKNWADQNKADYYVKRTEKRRGVKVFFIRLIGNNFVLNQNNQC